MKAREKWTIDPEKTLVLGSGYPDHKWTFEAAKWVYQRFPATNIISYSIRGDVTTVRNQIIKRYVLNSRKKYDHYVMLDANDVRPDADSDPVFLLESDIKVCITQQENPKAYSAIGSFHQPLYVVKREVFEGVGLPAFSWEYNQDHTAYKSCSCQSFRRRALAKGFTIACGGFAAHSNDGSHFGYQ